MPLINEAIKYSRVSKGEAQKIVKSLYERHPESIKELGMLYAYFMPPMPKSAKSNFAWVAKACNPKDVSRPFSCYVFATDNGELVATEGPRLHLSKSEGREPGYYHPKTEEKVNEEFIYPDFRRVIPDKEGRILTELKLSDLETIELGKTLFLVIENEHGKTAFNKKYILDAANGDDTPSVYIEQNERPRILLIEKGEQKAVIMGTNHKI